MSNSNNAIDRLVAITTFDNPFNPFTQFTEWLLFDKEKGYNTCEYLARIAKVEDNLSQQEYNRAVEQAIDSIIKTDPFNIYKKITNNSVAA
ncbi:hypothetical protein [Coprococcus sp. HCN-4056]|jgi:hypothetical protein|uniref:hypothetical protein n=1 Tax=Coprococcus sp. HCN-4056 TaxID=3134671 RepID=UPI0020480113|nr:MAG TPA: hypothetical protein [Caudoviricetes sp.]